MVKYRRPSDQIRDLKVVDQQITNLQIDARGSELYSYNVVWTAETGTVSLGNGSLIGKYRRVGSMVLVNIRLVIGSTTSQGTGTWNWSPPFQVDTSSYWAGTCIAYNDSNSATGPWIAGNSLIEPTGPGANKIAGIVGPIGGSTGTSGVARLKAGMPVTWDTNSSIFISIWYGTTE
jgi:hypothetical protein